MLPPLKVNKESKTEPLCPLFGVCGGCSFQDCFYEEELRFKEAYLRASLSNVPGIEERLFGAIVASPRPYHYRSRLDLGLLRTKAGETLMGFMPEGRFKVVPVGSCAIALQSISTFLPQLRKEAVSKLPAGYRTANLVVKTGDDGRVRWGGIGRRSLRLEKEDYLWTQVGEIKIFYSLDTFFQANLSILPLLIGRLKELWRWDQETLFCDLYAGVGLFGLCLAKRVHRVIMIEDNPAALNLARFNAAYQGLEGIEFRLGRVENELPPVLASGVTQKRVLFADPPRGGLSPQALNVLVRSKASAVFYLSCSPDDLARDLKAFVDNRWVIQNIIPFDFFPKTKHLETLIMMVPDENK